MRALFLTILFNINFIDSFYGSPMNHIFKNIYLGDYCASWNENYLQLYDIHTAVNIAAELDNNYKDLKSYELYLSDIPSERLFPIFEDAYNFVKNNLYHNILVYCDMGISVALLFFC